MSCRPRILRRARSAPPFRRSPAALTPRDVYKSKTTHADHRVWRDVYRPKTPAGEVYLKLTVLDHVAIMSFKEL